MESASRLWYPLGGFHVMLAVSLAFASYHVSSGLYLALASILLGQLMLLGVWVVFSDELGLYRPIIYTLLTGLAFLTGLNPSQISWESALPLIATGLVYNLFTVVVPCAIARWSGWRLSTSMSSKQKGWRFSIQSIFALTVVVAVLIALRQFIVSFGTPNEDGSITMHHSTYSWIAMLAVFGINGAYTATLTLTSAWSCFGDLSRLAATFCVMLVAAALPPHFTWGSDNVQWIWTIVCSTLVTLLSMLYLRWRGVRLVRIQDIAA